jgi:hypothetical protein
MPNIVRTVTKPKDLEAKNFIVQLLSPHFGFDISNRITVISDLNHFQLTDPFVWDQGVDKFPRFFEVYWDGVWICDFTDHMQGARMLVKFLTGFKDQLLAGKVFLNEKTDFEKYIIEKAVKDDIKDLENKSKAIRNKRAGSEEDAMSHEAIAQILDEKIEKKKNSRKFNKLKG